MEEWDATLLVANPKVPDDPQLMHRALGVMRKRRIGQLRKEYSPK